MLHVPARTQPGFCLLLIFVRPPWVPLQEPQAPSCLTQHLSLEIIGSGPILSTHPLVFDSPPELNSTRKPLATTCVRMAGFSRPLAARAAAVATTSCRARMLLVAGLWAPAPAAAALPALGPLPHFLLSREPPLLCLSLTAFIFGSGGGGADGFTVSSAGSLRAREDRKGFRAMGLLLGFVSHSVGSLGWV